MRTTATRVLDRDAGSGRVDADPGRGSDDVIARVARSQDSHVRPLELVDAARLTSHDVAGSAPVVVRVLRVGDAVRVPSIADTVVVRRKLRRRQGNSLSAEDRTERLAICS